MTELTIPSLSSKIENLTFEASLLALDKEWGSQIVFTTSFGLEDQAITHAIFSQNLSIRIVTLDTGRLFRETYELFQRTIDLYKKPIEAFIPNTKELEIFINKNGPDSFYTSIENRKQCCHIRKVLPLNRALRGAKLWITGIRKEQSNFRTDMPKFELDSARAMIKFHPILDWSWDETLQYVKSKGIPFNPLHELGYPSIGCAPCTRAIQPGEDFRAGRWWWENESNKECGLHWVDGKLTPTKGEIQ